MLRVIPFSQTNVTSLMIIVINHNNCCLSHTGIISLLPGMAALIHLKVLRIPNDDPTRSDEVFSDVPLGQTKVKHIVLCDTADHIFFTHKGFRISARS